MSLTNEIGQTVPSMRYTWVRLGAAKIRLEAWAAVAGEDKHIPRVSFPSYRASNHRNHGTAWAGVDMEDVCALSQHTGWVKTVYNVEHLYGPHLNYIPISSRIALMGVRMEPGIAAPIRCGGGIGRQLM